MIANACIYRKDLACLVALGSMLGIVAGVFGMFLSLGGLLPMKVYLPATLMSAYGIRWSYRNGGFED